MRFAQLALVTDLVADEAGKLGALEMDVGQVDPCTGLGDEELRFGENRLDLAGSPPGDERPGTDQVGGAEEHGRALSSRQRHGLVRERLGTRYVTAPQVPAGQARQRV